jgi:hypothetical protein
MKNRAVVERGEIEFPVEQEPCLLSDTCDIRTLCLFIFWINQNLKYKKVINYGGAMWSYGYWKNSFIVIDFVDWLLKDVFPNNEIYLIHDTWSAHKSNVFKGYADLQPRLNLVPLPTTC